MKEFTQADLERWSDMVGSYVWKNPKTSSKFMPKPFKSGRKVNTVKAVVTHEQTGRPGFSFEEDDSVVECFRCSLAPLDMCPVLTVEEHDRLDELGVFGDVTCACLRSMV